MVVSRLVWCAMCLRMHGVSCSIALMLLVWNKKCAGSNHQFYFVPMRSNRRLCVVSINTLYCLGTLSYLRIAQV